VIGSNFHFCVACFKSSQSAFFSRYMECQRGLAMRKMSVRPPVKRVDCDETEERFVQIFIPYESLFSLVF